MSGYMTTLESDEDTDRVIFFVFMPKIFYIKKDSARTSKLQK